MFIMCTELHYLRTFSERLSSKMQHIPIIRANIPELRRLIEASHTDVQTINEPCSYNLDKEACALKLQNISVVKAQRLHRALGHIHFSSLDKKMIEFDLDSVPDLLMPCKWVTGAAEHLSSHGKLMKMQEAVQWWCQIKRQSRVASPH